MTTLITFLLDRTGSMASIKDDTMGAFNAYLDALRDTPDIEFSLVQFDSMGIDKTCVNTPVRFAPRLSNENYQPRASTPLIDAAYKTIKAIEKSTKERPWITKVIMCIQTDGFENASREHTWDQLNFLIKEKTESGWAFNFMGASIDAYVQGARMGIGISNTVSYDGFSTAATQSIFTTRAQNHGSYSMGLVGSAAISNAEKLKAGDKFIPDAKVNIPLANLAMQSTTTKIASLVEDFSL